MTTIESVEKIRTGGYLGIFYSMVNTHRADTTDNRQHRTCQYDDDVNNK